MDNVLAIMQATAVDGVLGISATFVIITAGIDLSVGALLSLSSVLTATMMVDRKSTRLNSSHVSLSRMPSSA